MKTFPSNKHNGSVVNYKERNYTVLSYRRCYKERSLIMEEDADQLEETEMTGWGLDTRWSPPVN